MTDRSGVSADRVLTALRPLSDLERRTPLTPETVKTFSDLGWKCVIPNGLGQQAGWDDGAYECAGGSVSSADVVADADVVLCVEPPSTGVITILKPGSLLVGLLQPFRSQSLFESARDTGISTIAMELIPRSTIAQSMDALSSQASLAGYASVLRAASRLPRTLPMMSTPAGTIPPARVLVIGTGVAGLQAIATAVRLGARVTAYDVRPTAKEQVESLGARFAKVDLESSTETKDGYARALTDEQLARQREALVALCHESDIIIATAQVFGKPAPVIIERDMLAGMKPGSVIVDLAIGTGGNVEGSRPGMDEVIDGVTVLADPHMASGVAHDASNMFASNIVSLLKHIMAEDGSLVLDRDSDILRSVLVTHAGQILATAATPNSIIGATAS
ncbi:MAG: NAD(P) transhydrogenase subunit alpha [Phycisphaerales bacterium JB065]